MSDIPIIADPSLPPGTVRLDWTQREEALARWFADNDTSPLRGRRAPAYTVPQADLHQSLDALMEAL